MARMMRRALLAVLLGLVAVLSPALPAAADAGAPITDLAIDVQLRADGRAEVTMDLTMDFSARSGRGPILQFFTTQQDGQHPDEEYVFDFSDPQVTSSTGARTDLNVDRGMHAVVWRIGDEAQRDESRHLIQQLREEMAMSLGIEA